MTGINKYFNNYSTSAIPEQRIMEDLITESISIMGFNGFYLPNDNSAARDLMYGEDPVKKFQSAFNLPMYLSSNPTDYIGQRDIFTKFGLEIKDDINVMISRRAFQQSVPQNSFTRPREGDLVYVPVTNGFGELFEIKFVEHNKDFNMLGKKYPYFYELVLEKFKYSQEVISTGVPDIDSVVTNNAYTLDLTVLTGLGVFVPSEIVYQSPDETFANATASAIVQTYSPLTEILTVTNIVGEFLDGQSIIGQTSGAEWQLATYDPLNPSTFSEQYDNKTIESGADVILDLSETNPFGSI
jgi:hypothetical protein